MGRSLHKLTAIQAAKLKVPGRHSDGGGLYLSIDDSGRRRWVFIYTRGGRRTELGLGGGRDLSLANARVEAAAFRAMLAEGLDPKVERAKDDQAQTFGACADAYVEAMRPSWRNEKHAAQWKMTLTKYAAPTLLDTDQHPGSVDVGDLEVGDLRNAKAAAIGDAEDGFVFELAGTVQQERHLLGTKHFWQAIFPANRR